jgi:hypothetical protein
LGEEVVFLGEEGVGEVVADKLPQGVGEEVGDR